MYLFIEKGLRGVISYIAKRYSEANNKFMETTDPKKLSKYISHLDMNNLCGKRMTRYLPYGNKINSKIANLGDKTNYIVHYINFQLYVLLGMKLTKIHRVLRFKQSDWMKIYIDFNTKKEVMLLIVLKKNFFKLMINSAYGKTMENLKKRINIRLVNKQKSFLKHIFDKNYAAIHEIKSALALNKPIHVGFTIIELSKRLMYDFHYNFI